MNLTQINFENWQSYKGPHELIVPTGLIKITGDNRDGEGSITNRAGKTSLINTIMGCCYGCTPLVNSISELITIGETYAKLRLAFDSNIIIDRTIAAPSALYFNGNSITQKELDLKLTIDASSFMSAIFLGTNYSDFLEKVLRKPNDAKEQLTNLMPNLKVFDAAHKRIGIWQKEVQGQIAELEAKVTGLLGKLEGLKHIDYAAKTAEWKEKRSQGLAIRIKQIKELKSNPLIKDGVDIKQREEEINSLNILHKSAQAKLNMVQNQISSTNYNITITQRAITKLSEDLAKANKGTCPTCGQALASNEVKQNIKKEIEENKKLLTTYEQQAQEFPKTLTVYMQKALELEGKVNSLRSALNQYIRAYADLQALIDSYNNLKAQTDPWAAEYITNVKLIATIEADIIKLESNIKKIKELDTYYEFWNRGFGNMGIKNFVFDEVIYSLTEFANEYLSIMSEGTIFVRFNPRKQKKTGGFSEKIGLEVYNKNDRRSFFTWSGSERKRVGLATSMALNKVLKQKFGCPFDFLIFDEALDSLDTVGIEYFLRCLKTMVNLGELKTIFLICHVDIATNLFDHTITVIKENGYSRIELNSGTQTKLLRRRTK